MNRARQILDQVFEARRRKPVTPAEAPAAPLFNDAEADELVLTSLGYGDFLKFIAFLDKYDIYTSGKVRRTSNHYVHEKTTDLEFEVETYRPDIPEPDRSDIEGLADVLQKGIGEEIVDVNKKIYRALEREYDYHMSDEAVADSIIANEYKYDEDGDWDNEGGNFTYDQLSDAAKERARDAWRNVEHPGDNYWSEHTIDEWKAELEEMGFSDPDISWSGFSSQGDGASFTCDSFDIRKYATFFMSGKTVERGRPYTDEKYAKEYAAQAAAAQAALPEQP